MMTEVQNDSGFRTKIFSALSVETLGQRTPNYASIYLCEIISRKKMMWLNDAAIRWIYANYLEAKLSEIQIILGETSFGRAAEDSC
jgi:hypothetical protein